MAEHQVAYHYSHLPTLEADLHCHILPGLDDGATDFEQAVQMCRLYAQQGTKTIVATPHMCHPTYDAPVCLAREQVGRLAEACVAESIDLSVLPGAEVRLTPELLEYLEDQRLLTLADGSTYLLLELPPRVVPPIEDLLFQLGLRGITVVLAHPERNRVLARDTRRLRGLVERGCLVQICVGSVLGDFGRSARRAAFDYLRGGLVHVVAGDAHGPEAGYWPDFQGGIQEIAAHVGLEKTRELIAKNPARIAKGENVEAGVHLPERGM